MVSHLSYADDIIIFTRAYAPGITQLMDFLKDYQQGSGQQVNIAKSAILFSSRVAEDARQNLLNLTGFQLKNFPITYLGVPLSKGRNKIVLFDGILAKIRNRLQGWYILTLFFPSDSPDIRIWCDSVHGEVHSRLAYEKLRPSFPRVNWGEWIWSKCIPVRRSIFVWRLIHGRLPLLDTLRSRGFVGPNICSLCYCAAESIDHCFVDCT